MLLRQIFAEVITTQAPQQALDLMAHAHARRDPARRQFRARRDRRRRGFPLARADARARSRCGDRADHRAWRRADGGRRDEARRDRLRLQALGQRAAARHRPHRRGAAQLAPRDDGREGQGRDDRGHAGRHAAAGYVARHRARALADRARRADRRQRADPRRERHGQGTGRARAASAVGSQCRRDAVGRSRRGRGEPVRFGAVRPCEGRVHRCARRPGRATAGRRRRHAVPRRGRQPAASPPAQAAHRARTAAGDAGRRQSPGADRRPRRLGDQPADRGTRRRAALPAGSAVPAQHRRDRAAAVARAARGHPAAARYVHRLVQPQIWQARARPAAVGARRARRLRLAGQRPRAAPRRRARGDPGGRDAASRSATSRCRARRRRRLRRLGRCRSNAPPRPISTSTAPSAS